MENAEWERVCMYVYVGVWGEDLHRCIIYDHTNRPGLLDRLNLVL